MRGSAGRAEAKIRDMTALSSRGVKGRGTISDRTCAIICNVVGFARSGTQTGSEIVSEIGEAALQTELTLVGQIGAKVGRRGGWHSVAGLIRVASHGALKSSVASKARTSLTRVGRLRLGGMRGVGSGFGIFAKTGKTGGSGGEHVANLTGAVEVELLLQVALKMIGLCGQAVADGVEIAMIVGTVHGCYRYEGDMLKVGGLFVGGVVLLRSCCGEEGWYVWGGGGCKETCSERRCERREETECSEE